MGDIHAPGTRHRTSRLRASARVLRGRGPAGAEGAGTQGLYAKMVDAFKKMGLEVVPGVGAHFDPSLHEAIMRAPSPDHPDGTVLQEFRRGFSIDGVLLRPAMVQASRHHSPRHTIKSPEIMVSSLSSINTSRSFWSGTSSHRNPRCQKHGSGCTRGAGVEIGQSIWIGTPPMFRIRSLIWHNDSHAMSSSARPEDMGNSILGGFIKSNASPVCH